MSARIDAALLEHIFSRIVANPTTGCWLWEGATTGEPQPGATGRGYGKICITVGSRRRRFRVVHRVVYELVYGPLKPHHQVDHECCVRLCVRPEHLKRTTHLQNMRNRDERNRRRKSQLVCEEINV